MATPVGTNTVTSIARRFIVPEITDNVYRGNLIFFRLVSGNKRVVRGGFQLEVPLMYSRMAAGGAYTGYDILDITPSDTVRNAAFDWKQYYVPVNVDGLTLIKVDQPEAIADYIKAYFAQAEMEMAEDLGAGLWSTTSGKNIDGIPSAVDDGSTTGPGTYGGIDRTVAGNSWWRALLDTTSYTSGGTKFSINAAQLLFGAATEGGRHPTIIVSGQPQYTIFYNLNVVNQAFPVAPQLQDEQLAQAGFTNLLFNGVPWAVDPHVPTSHVYYLNEDYIEFAVSPRADFYLEDFQTPVQQDAMVAKLLWAGNLIFKNLVRQAKFTSVAG